MSEAREQDGKHFQTTITATHRATDPLSYQHTLSYWLTGRVTRFQKKSSSRASTLIT
jgi:hypothetical protein